MFLQQTCKGSSSGKGSDFIFLRTNVLLYILYRDVEQTSLKLNQRMGRRNIQNKKQYGKYKLWVVCGEVPSQQEATQLSAEIKLQSLMITHFTRQP